MGPVGPVSPTEGFRTTEDDVVDWKLYFNQAFGILPSSTLISLVTVLFEPCNHCTTVVLLLPSARY